MTTRDTLSTIGPIGQSLRRHGWTRLALAVGASLMLSGCGMGLSSGVTTELPDLKAVPKKVLSDADQKKAIADMAKADQEREAAAIKAIAGTSPAP